MMITQQRSPQLRYELSEAIAHCDGTELDLQIGGLKSPASDLLRGERAPGVLLLEIDVDDVDDMGAPVLDVRRYSRFGRQLRDKLEHSLRDPAVRPAPAGAH